MVVNPPTSRAGLQDGDLARRDDIGSFEIRVKFLQRPPGQVIVYHAWSLSVQGNRSYQGILPAPLNPSSWRGLLPLQPYMLTGEPGTTIGDADRVERCRFRT